MRISFLFKKIIGKGNQEKIVKGVFWSFLGTFISKVFVFVALFIVARMLSVKEYGKLGLLESYINTFTLFSLASFGTTTTKYLAIYYENDKAKASQIYSLTRIFVLSLSALILVFSYFFNDMISQYIVGDPKLKTEVLICSISIYFSSIHGLQVGALAGLQNFRSISIIDIVNGVLSLPLTVIAAHYYGIRGVVVVLAIVNFSIWLCSALLLKKEMIKNKLSFTFLGLKQHFKVLSLFSLPAFLSSIMLSPVVLICNSFLIKYNSNGYYELGIYNAVFMFYQVGTILIGIIGQVFYPMAMQNFGKNNRKFDFFNINNSYIIGIVIFLPILILPDLFSGFYGHKYENSSMYYSMIFISFSSIIVAQRQGIARNFAAGNFMWFSVLSNLIWAASTISFSYFLVQRGATGRSFSLFMGYLINTLVFIPFYIKKNLITKGLIFCKEHLYIILLIVFAWLSFLLIENIFLRLLILIIIILLCLASFRLWYRNYLRNE